MGLYRYGKRLVVVSAFFYLLIEKIDMCACWSKVIWSISKRLKDANLEEFCAY